jgi:hypothetical protein
MTRKISRMYVIGTSSWKTSLIELTKIRRGNRQERGKFKELRSSVILPVKTGNPPLVRLAVARYFRPVAPGMCDKRRAIRAA